MDGTMLSALQKEVHRRRDGQLAYSSMMRSNSPAGAAAIRRASTTSPATPALKSLSGDRDESAAFATVCC